MGSGKTAVVTTLQPAFHPETGEHIADIHVDRIVKAGRRKKTQRGGFVMLSKVGLKKIELTGAQWSVFAQLLAHMDHTNGESRIMLQEIAEATGTKSPNVSRCMKELQDRDMVIKLGVGRYRINSHIAHLAGADDDIVDSDPEPKWSRQ